MPFLDYNLWAEAYGNWKRGNAIDDHNHDHQTAFRCFLEFVGLSSLPNLVEEYGVARGGVRYYEISLN